ncbi:type 2 lantipeptide synthetase LanM family protein [Amphibacillus sp. MSJ-3]|uniref:type 2 lanthipeptide synthetase LanM family protein n=1 Tax=Amphibacillus sp. MSJ-3 TaxID=2841505 RepID=UPI001C0F243E|nr:type 2 lantipeptide synthetase LanM family protein [Amphibacillus sp. MSJ-3]
MKDLPYLQEDEVLHHTKGFEWLEDWNILLQGQWEEMPYDPFEQIHFKHFIQHFIKLAKYKLHVLLTDVPSHLIDKEAIVTELVKELSLELFTMCEKTLVLELNILRETGQLKGESPEERYAYFEEVILKKQSFLAELGEEYPVLIRAMIERINQWCLFVQEIFDHFNNDWEFILEHFPEMKHAGKVKKFHLGMGDTHQRGKSVTIVEFENGSSIVYKPRSVEVDHQYQELLQWVNTTNESAPYLYPLKVIPVGDHGWMEYVPYKTCQTMAEIGRFYQRMGAHLALLYVLNATDFHYGNIIAMGEYPILIDLESLFHQDIFDGTYGEEALGQAEKLLSESIMASGMLPNKLYQREENAGIDLSGLGGQGNQQLPFEIAQMDHVGTDQVTIKMGAAYLESGLNLPTYKGEFVNLHEYFKEIESGFIQVYQFLASHKKELIQQLQKFKDVKVRTIVRPTNIYGEFLRSMYHPDLLRDALDRDVFLHRLWIRSLALPKIERLIAYEKNDLHLGDVPLFTSKPGEKDLWSSGGEKISDFFQNTALETVIKKVERLGDQDLYEQLQVLHMVMLASNANHYADVEAMDPFLPTDNKVEKMQFLQQAIDIGNYLIKTKIEGENKGKKDATWISTVLEGTNEVAWQISPVGLDFYNGNSGIVLFLAYLAELSGEEKFKLVAQQGLVPILHDMKNFKDHSDWSLGAYSGVGGNIFTTFQLATLWQDEELLEVVMEALPGYQAMIKEDNIFDYIGGAAGALDIFLHIYKQTAHPLALEGALLSGKHLMANTVKLNAGGIGWKSIQQQTPLTGYSHGNAGISAALSALYNITGEDSILTYIAQALEYERTFYREAERNWMTPQREEASIAWCHGAPGILLSRLRLKENGYQDDQIDQEIEVALDTTLRLGFGNNRSYCHGDFGQLEILLYADKLLQNVDLNPSITSVQKQILELMKEKMWNYGVSRGTESKGLLTGLAGFGFGLLKQFDRERVPNILNLEN